MMNRKKKKNEKARQFFESQWLDAGCARTYVRYVVSE